MVLRNLMLTLRSLHLHEHGTMSISWLAEQWAIGERIANVTFISYTVFDIMITNFDHWPSSHDMRVANNIAILKLASI